VVDLSGVSLSDLAAATGNLDFGGYKGVNVADPAADQDAATKKYHDDHKYTDAEAVAAADASDKFVERSVENVCTGITTIKRNTTGRILDTTLELASGMFYLTAMQQNLKSTNTTFQNMFIFAYYPSIVAYGADINRPIGSFTFSKVSGYLSSSIAFILLNENGTTVVPLELFWDKIDVKNKPIKDIKNHADATLSGTPRIVEFLIGNTPYYFKVYPTKT